MKSLKIAHVSPFAGEWFGGTEFKPPPSYSRNKGKIIKEISSKIKKDRSLIMVGIPAYNEEKSLSKVIIQTMKYVTKVIVCDDGSTDMTAEIAENLGAITLRHKKNRGKGAALRTIFNYVKPLYPDIVITIDADGQHNCREITKLIQPILENKADMVIGSRYLNRSKMDAPLYRRFGLYVINWLINNVNKIPIKDTQCGFRAYNRKALETVSKLKVNGYDVETEQLNAVFKRRLRVTEVPVTVKYKGIEKASKKSPLKHGSEIITNIFKKAIELRNHRKNRH